MPGGEKQAAHSIASGSGPGRRHRLVSSLRRAATAIAALAVIALCTGFFLFTARVPDKEISFTSKADGIVVFTGGASRVVDAIELLAAGHGQRLLITGVYPSTNSSELKRLIPRYEQLFACCIDLDHVARNTVENALETRRWTRDRGFHSLVVVTSSYHMPRAMAELSYQMPDVALVAFPVISAKQRGDQWWTGGHLRLLISEYLKFLLSSGRMYLGLDFFALVANDRAVT
jgi:uncharacterized SAM-binding protein YcdF (DUF218 family)